MADTFKLMTYKGRPTRIKMGNESFTITTNQKMGVKRVNDAYHFLVNVDRRNWQFTLPQANARLLLSKMVDGVQASDVLDNLKMFMRTEMPLLQTGFCNRFQIDKGKFAWKQPLNDVYYYAMPLKLVDTDTVNIIGYLMLIDKTFFAVVQFPTSASNIRHRVQLPLLQDWVDLCNKMLNRVSQRFNTNVTFDGNWEYIATPDLRRALSNNVQKIAFQKGGSL